MVCQYCQKATTEKNYGLFQLDCPTCCVRLVEQTKPDQLLAKGMIAFITRRNTRPTKETILKLMKAKRDDKANLFSD